MSVKHSTCCGLKEFYNLDEPKDQLLEIFATRVEYRFAMALFTDNFKGGRRGAGLKKLIEKLGVGTVTETPLTKNPNSGRNIRAWIYIIDYPKLAKWALDYAGGDYKKEEEYYPF